MHDNPSPASGVELELSGDVLRAMVDHAVDHIADHLQALPTRPASTPPPPAEILHALRELETDAAFRLPPVGRRQRRDVRALRVMIDSMSNGLSEPMSVGAVP